MFPDETNPAYNKISSSSPEVPYDKVTVYYLIYKTTGKNIILIIIFSFVLLLFEFIVVNHIKAIFASEIEFTTLFIGIHSERNETRERNKKNNNNSLLE